jgi:cation diffusion facilitator CzcD-associated flavoprotein CzcO
MSSAPLKRQTDKSTDSMDWLIVGGGIHGVHMGVRLIAEAGVAPERLLIVDPGSRLLECWRTSTRNTGMTHLRSPAVHHLGLKPFDLLRFSGANCRGRGAPMGSFAQPYARPSVEIFESHCDTLIDRYGLASRHLKDRVLRATPTCDSVGVEMESGRTVRTQHLVLALGAAEQPRWPSWAEALRDEGAKVEQLFAPGFHLETDDWPDRVCVVGGGISGVQAAIKLADAGKEVSIITRHAFRKHRFDSDPGWVGPKNMNAFSAVSDPAVRRGLITHARHPGSVPPKLFRTVKRAIANGTIRHHIADPFPVTTEAGICIPVGDTSFCVDALLLATGFASHRPGGALVDTLVETHALPCAECGYPIVDKYLRWHSRVCVTGPLAELEIGPVSRNIVGARRAAERIVRLAVAS